MDFSRKQRKKVRATKMKMRILKVTMAAISPRWLYSFCAAEMVLVAEVVVLVVVEVVVVL